MGPGGPQGADVASAQEETGQGWKATGVPASLYFRLFCPASSALGFLCFSALLLSPKLPVVIRFIPGTAQTQLDPLSPSL